MGKDLKGKELGTGISQRKDGYYIGRYTDNIGVRHQKIFQKLQECKKWVANEESSSQSSDLNVPEKLTVAEWYKYWIEIKERTVRPTTLESYINRYKVNIEPIIGNRILSSITTMDCQRILNKMADKNYKSSSIGITRIVLYNFLDYAYQNDIISRNPCTKQVKHKIGKPSDSRTALSIENQRKLCDALIGHKFELNFRFVLQTGLRVGELTGLKWEDIDFKNKTLSVKRTMKYDNSVKDWKSGEPKSKNGFRTIPLTDEAIEILQKQKRKNSLLKTVDIRWADIVFLDKKGKPISLIRLDEALSKICNYADLPKISMHILRHTFATRCNEAGMSAKTLQIIMGHSNITTTMNLYVHTTDEQKQKEMDMVSKALSVG